MSADFALLRAFRSVLASFFKFQWVAGFALGLWSLIQIQSWVLVTDLDSVAPFLSVSAIGTAFALASRVSRWIGTQITEGLLLLLSAGLVALIPVTVSLSLIPFGFFSDLALESFLIRGLSYLPAAIFLLMVPATLIAGYAVQQERDHRPCLGGLVSGFAIGLLFLLPGMGTTITLWSCVGLLVLAAAKSMGTMTQSSTLAVPSETGQVAPLKNCSGAFAIFVMLPSIIALLQTWTLLSLWSMLVPPLAFAGGFWFMFRLNRWNWSRRLAVQISAQTLCTLSLLCGLASIVGQDWFLARIMEISYSISTVLLVQILKGAILGLVPFTVGLASTQCISENGEAFRIRGQVLLASAYGFGLLLVAFSVSPEMVVSLSTLLFVVLQIAHQLQESSVEHGRARFLFQIGLLVVIALPGFFAGKRDTAELPARVLYSGSAMNQFQKGTDWSQLKYLDHGRMGAVIRTSRATYVGVEYNALQTRLRRNGIPIGYVSHDYRLMPQFPVDVLLSAIPLSTHPAPNRVGVLNWGSGVTVSTAMEYPIVTLDCFGADPSLVEMTYPKKGSTPWRGMNPQTDDRIQLSSLSSATAMRGKGADYDVLISNSTRTEELFCAREYTREFYLDCANRLNSGGLFCQRYQHHDHGPEALLEILSTIKSVFPNVMTINLLPGETLVLGSASDLLNDLESVVTRVRSGHNRRVLARCGWDWGHLIKLPAISVENVNAMLKQHSLASNRLSQANIAWNHSINAMRWGNKWEEKAIAFQGAKGRLADLMGDEGRTADVIRRIEEVQTQQYVMSEFSDRPWAYRAKVKEMLLQKPRTTLVQVKGENPRNEMHPVDQTRVDYIKALGRAYKPEQPEAEAIHSLTGFVAPYDPMISYFVHHEAAELYSRNPELSPASEYLHRLVSIHFGDVRDFSVRGVIRAIELLLDHPEILDQDPERFEHLHAMLQTLYNRWVLRRGVSPRTAGEGMIDVRSSIEITNRALGELERLAPTANYDDVAWEQRKAFFEESLIRPLRSYRGQLLPSLEKQQKNARADSEPEISVSEPSL